MDEQTVRLLELTDKIMQIFCISSEKAKQVILESMPFEPYDLGK
jgi:hypothetical protein